MISSIEDQGRCALETTVSGNTTTDHHVFERLKPSFCLDWLLCPLGLFRAIRRVYSIYSTSCRRRFRMVDTIDYRLWYLRVRVGVMGSDGIKCEYCQGNTRRRRNTAWGKPASFQDAKAQKRCTPGAIFWATHLSVEYRVQYSVQVVDLYQA